MESSSRQSASGVKSTCSSMFSTCTDIGETGVRDGAGGERPVSGTHLVLELEVEGLEEAEQLRGGVQMPQNHEVERVRREDGVQVRDQQRAGQGKRRLHHL